MRQGKYAQIRALDVANGEGIRVSIFVTGCTHNCPGCFNALYKDFDYGQPWTEQTTEEVLRYLRPPVIAGLTLLGGEPMQNLWLTEVVQQLQEARLAEGRKPVNVWVYSGYTFEQIMAHRGRRELLSQCDVLVDGLYRADLRDLRLKFRGSANQRILNVGPSMAQNKPIWLEQYRREYESVSNCGHISIASA